MVANGKAGFCILDATLAAAGPLPVLQAALDQYKSANRKNAAALLDRARSVPETYQVYGISTGSGNFVAQNMPTPNQGMDIGQVFRTMQNTFFEVDLRNGMKAMADGWAVTPKDAKTVSDALRGMIGMGRLNTPDNKPELLRLWDGIKVDLSDRRVTLTIDVSQDLVDELVKQVQGPSHK